MNWWELLGMGIGIGAGGLIAAAFIEEWYSVRKLEKQYREMRSPEPPGNWGAPSDQAKALLELSGIEAAWRGGVWILVRPGYPFIGFTVFPGAPLEVWRHACQVILEAVAKFDAEQPPR